MTTNEIVEQQVAGAKSVLNSVQRMINRLTPEANGNYAKGYVQALADVAEMIQIQIEAVEVFAVDEVNA